ncbi:MAG: hypothetical protein A2087_03420 [Spirochaetes bacterium GWD1_61_31]|nr:MAG: hypothetical protein A2Y37_11180 [Spirochaetes bacterium GWB1_60_80]OHD35339.1 MAG: hypothetical protein A2004_00415 [Spirochaetes bacterium GWC1_61_12]OHD36108.1 MAG: hypothetical protein A2087_03420 [Spirochaetes bacterium GWD1_61_31]OHD44995.1 MAG: hypothetical protein A2Y35_13225 [Spirochaetes bacterium GWE1_60_18]OHD60104.1 MAG: hypothetical protein A2Y32_11335 [Spirochaetes bacterium GWF1_60_12]HAP43674.1 hypothetical protein [Spirochaetaceae bacterium]
MPASAQATPQRLPQLLLSLGLILLGALVNYRLSLELAFGISIQVGNSLAILALCLSGSPWGMLAPMLSMLPTVALWGHPWALASYLLEGILLYRLVKKGQTDQVIWADTLFWPLVGIPLIILQYRFLLGMQFGGALAAAIKQGAAALFNVATGLLFWDILKLAAGRWRRRTSQTTPFELATGQDMPKAREYLLMFLNISLVLPFFIGIMIFVHSERANIVTSAENEVALILETLNRTLSDKYPFVPSSRFRLFAGYDVSLREADGQLLWSTNPEGLRYAAREGRFLTEHGNLSIRTDPGETNPMQAWLTATIHGRSLLDNGRSLIVERPFASAAQHMNAALTGSLVLLLAWLAIASSVAKFFTVFLTAPLEKLRHNAEKLQNDPTQTVGWPEFRIMEIQELRDSLVAMTGALTNRSVDLEEAQRTAQTMLQQSEHYLTFMGHELKAPIAAIYSALELLNEEPEKASRIVGMIKDSTYNLIQLINDIIDQARAKSGKLQFHDDWFSPFKETISCLETFAIQARRKNLEFFIAVDPRLDCATWGDKQRFRQILSNLTSNAIKYTGQGFIRLSLDAELKDPSRLTLRGSIEDSGSGIAPESLPYIWEAFALAKGKLSATQSSHGLGLSIIKSIVDNLGGSIGVTSELGKGSTFSFVLPLPLQAPQALADKLSGASGSLLDA